MPGLFGIYHLASRTLQSYQAAMSTVGHNVSGAGTEGFHRQRVNMRSTLPQITGWGALGTGVTVDNVQRIEDRFLEHALQRELPTLTRFEARATALAQSELAFGEPSDSGLTTLLDEYFGAWSDLASAPEDGGARESVVRVGVSLADAIRTARRRLTDQQEALTGEIAREADTAADLAGELATLNRSIRAATRNGIAPADLEDRRDQIAGALARSIGATAQVEDDGTATVRIGGRVLVQGESAEALRFDRAEADTPMLGDHALQGLEVDGRIGGLLEVRDVDLAEAIRRLDELAHDLAGEVNAIHRQGRAADGRPAGDFFVMTRLERDGVGGAAATLAVDPALLDDADRVAAGSSGEEGDNGVALDLAALRERLGGPSGRLQALVVEFGARARQAEDLATGQGVIVRSFEAQRESVSGVSLDEEATNLLQFQRSYEAAARVISIVDEMTQTLLSI